MRKQGEKPKPHLTTVERADVQENHGATMCEASEVASANPCAASGDSVPVTAPIIASLDAAPTNTGMGVREKNRKTFSPVADELLDDGRETF
ncbi:hypothetical protein PF002_g9717 [Phytophthora fragariae]|uniref:Uncharacterized protein n=1 Tax=Phytophthora fragariae TaxID=53985 RepID=A0A6A3ZSH1_9STRA|nr:hypothetical protein PF002_g9717 [Phytophthora fragariae]